MKGKSFWGRIALLAALFVAVLSAGMSLGLNTARVNAAVPEGTASITVSAGNVTSDMTYDEIKDVLVVTAFSGENGTGNNLGELDSADFEIVGVFAQGDSSTSTFKVVCGSVESVTFELPITVTSSQPREMTVTLNEGHGTIYSYTSLTTFQSYVTVHCVFWDGSERDLSQSEWGTNDNFTPETANVTESYDKEITIAYNAGTGTSNLTCDLLVEDIHPATPARLTVTGSQTVDANAAFGEYFTVRVEYGNDPFANAFVLAPGTYSIEYGNAAGTEFDSDATGFIYDNGAGTVRITYQENGASVPRLVQVTVRKIPTDPVSFSTASSNYQYTTQAENDGSVTVTGTDQTIQISNYYSDIMTITAVTKDNVAVDSSLYSAENGTITVRDAGEYQVTVQLTAPEYFFRNYPETQTSLTITYTVNRAPLNDLTLQLLDESDAPVTQWNRDDQITPTVTGNYGGGEVTYHYSGTNGTSYESNSLPTAAGSYEVYVSVAQSDNFREGQTSTISFQIGQRVLGLPTLAGAEGEGADLIYTGTSQAPTITYAGNNDATYLAITNNGGTDAGDYTVTFMINDATQAVWDTSAGSGITSDMLSNDNKTLTLEYQILPRRITMSTLSAVSSTYTGSEQEFTITNLNIPTNGTTGTAVTGAVNVSITPYDQGDTCSVSGSTFTVTNAGTYTITLALSSANYVWSDGSTAAIGCIFTMNKAVVDIPNAGSKTYDGSALTSNLENTDYYTVSQGTDWVNVKADGYPVTLTLRDTANYYWAGDTTSANNVNSASSATETVIFRITQASNGFISGPSITGWTYGDTANSPSGAEARFGTVEYRYSSSENGTYSTTVPTAADDYYVKAFVAETANWAAAESDAVLFTIEKRVIGITWTIGTYTYTGGEQAPTATATNVVSGDSLTLTVQGATDAGGHTATVTDITGTGADNYALPADCTTGFTISQATLTITWDEDTLSHTYDGVAFTPSYEVSGWQGSSNDGYTFTPEIADSNLLEGAAVNVGEYTVTLSISRSEGTCNYVLANNSIGFEITKAQLNIADYISEPEGYRGSNDDDRSIVYSGVLENSSLRYESSSLYTYVGRYGSDGTTASTATDVSAAGYCIVLKLT